MNTPQLAVHNSVSEQLLRHRLSYTLNQQSLFKAIDDDPSLIGAGVVFIDSKGVSITLREFEPICFTQPVQVVLREPPVDVSSSEYISTVKSNPRENNLVLEASGALLSCGAAVLGWVVVATATSTIPFSGGGSTVFTVMAYSAATASSIQCINGIVRTRNEARIPESNDNLDNQEWYQHANMALDAISLGGATAAGLATVKGIKMLLSSGITPMQALKGLNRQQRKRLSREIARSNYPGISSKTMKVMESAGKLEKRYSNTAIRRTTLRQIKDSIGIGLSVGGSALGGNVRKLAIAVVAGDE